MAKLRIGGAWSGVLEVELGDWTVAMLREEVANRSGCGGPHCLNLICAGRVLRDGDGTDKLTQLGVKNNAKILAAKVSLDQDGKSVKDEFLADEERSKRLSRLKYVEFFCLILVLGKLTWHGFMSFGSTECLIS